jgi:multidrug efflux pump subunit AcrA (membrane-fusion protein)
VQTITLEEAQAARAAVPDEAVGGVQSSDHAITAAKLQLSADQAKLKALQAGSSATEIAGQQARVDLLGAQADAASAAAQPTVILTAPFEGTIVEVAVRPGQAIVSSNTGADGIVASTGGAGIQTNDARSVAVRLVASAANSIMADVSESYVSQLSRGQTVDLSFPGVPGNSGTGIISEIGGAATVKDNAATYPVRVDMSALPPMVKLGMTVHINIKLGEARDVLIAPRESIRVVDGQTMVTTVDPSGRGEDAPVRVGRAYGANVELLDGVQEGDLVAVYQGTKATTRQP